MKNITVTMPEDLAAWLRVRAAENGRSEVQQFALVSRRDKAHAQCARLPHTGFVPVNMRIVGGDVFGDEDEENDRFFRGESQDVCARGQVDSSSLPPNPGNAAGFGNCLPTGGWLRWNRHRLEEATASRQTGPKEPPQ